MAALIRRERAVRRLPDDAACVVCGEADPVLLEQHHVAGRSNDQNAVVVMCLNHHRLQSVNQAAVGIELDSRHERSTPERVIAWLRGLALMFTELAQGCRRTADQLAAWMDGLDAQLPECPTPPDIDP